ncbi:unnamed protein product [Calicophoron daubneyi]|uniref:DNA/RNA-binding domain-containing protein n=1 Tax=Calicophoron daubneyi TaxID=300641 RepID=A0AAV2TM87_CALDB
MRSADSTAHGLDPYQSLLFSELKSLLSKKPPDTASSSAQDEFQLKSQELYCGLITKFPIFSVDQKLELEMWNVLYKTQIDSIQNALRRHVTGVNSIGGHPRSAIELKLRFVLLLDRASGVYFTIIHNLLQSLSDTAWPKSVLSAMTSMASPSGMFKFSRLGWSCGRFDLDLATFSALHRCAGPSYTELSWLRKDSDSCVADLSESTAAPRILSRGDRLPAEAINTNEQSAIGNENPVEDSDRSNRPSQTSDSDGKSSAPTDVNLLPDLLKPVSSIDHVTAVSYLIQHCLVHLGDVARYRQQPSVAAGYYLWAWVVHPDSGHPYNQLAILESGKPTGKKRIDVLLYYYVRAIACAFPFPAASTNLRSVLNTYSRLLNGAGSVDTFQEAVDDACCSHEEVDVSLHLLLFQAAVQMGTSSQRLIILAEKFGSAVEAGSHRAVDNQRLLRLVTLHTYLLSEYCDVLHRASSNNSSELSSLDDQSARTVSVVYVTVRLCDWLATLCKNFSVEVQHSAQKNEMETDVTDGFLPGLLILFIWLRQNCSLFGDTLETYAPSFSEDLVLLLNSLLEKCNPAELKWTASGSSAQVNSTSRSVSPAVSSSRSRAEDAGHQSTVEAQEEELEWTKLIQFPELLRLQGFLPLRVPTQRQLCFDQSVRPVCPFRIKSDLFMSSALPPTDAYSVDNIDSVLPAELELSCSTPHGAVDKQRSLFLIQSARIVAQKLPVLLEWKQGEPGDELSDYRFLHVVRSAPDLSKLLPVDPQEGSVGRGSTSENNRNSVSNSSVYNLNVPEVEKSGEVSTNGSRVCNSDEEAKLSSPVAESSTVITPSVLTLSSQSPLPSANPAVEENVRPPASTVKDTSEGVSEAPLTIGIEDAVTHNDTSGISEVSSAGSVRPPNPASESTITTSTSGGLIVNAELAKFIQEQASQVAARQQRVGLSSDADSSLDGRSDNTFRTSYPGYFKSLNGGKSCSSRLSLSAAFRRDLPPRFARRLQAELLEKEALENRQRQMNGSDSDPLIATSMNEPAPLARKESEAPYDLNSFLSSSEFPLSESGPGVPDNTAQLMASPPIGINFQTPVAADVQQLSHLPNMMPKIPYPHSSSFPAFNVPPMVAPMCTGSTFVPSAFTMAATVPPLIQPVCAPVSSFTSIPHSYSASLFDWHPQPRDRFALPSDPRFHLAQYELVDQNIPVTGQSSYNKFPPNVSPGAYFDEEAPEYSKLRFGKMLPQNRVAHDAAGSPLDGVTKTQELINFQSSELLSAQAQLSNLMVQPLIEESNKFPGFSISNDGMDEASTNVHQQPARSDVDQALKYTAVQ